MNEDVAKQLAGGGRGPAPRTVAGRRLRARDPRREGTGSRPRATRFGEPTMVAWRAAPIGVRAPPHARREAARDRARRSGSSGSSRARSRRWTLPECPGGRSRRRTRRPRERLPARRPRPPLPPAVTRARGVGVMDYRGRGLQLVRGAGRRHARDQGHRPRAPRARARDAARPGHARARRAADVELPEPSVARLSADGDGLYAVGARTVCRYHWDGRRLDRDGDWEFHYHGGPAHSYGWDPVISGGHLWLLDNGEHAYTTTMRAAGVATGPVRLLRVSLNDPGDPRGGRGVGASARRGHRSAAVRREPPDRDWLRLCQRRRAGARRRARAAVASHAHAAHMNPVPGTGHW